MQMAQGGMVKMISAQCPYEQGEAIAMVAANGLLGKAVPSFIGVEPISIDRENLLKGMPDEGRRMADAMYERMLFGNKAYKELFRALEAGETPVLFHCSAGKDRTGVAAMLILLALGVSRADALADYMLTNVYRREIIERFLADKPAAERDLLLPVEGVSEPMGAGAIDEILRRYPSYEAYFADEFGLDAVRLKALRDFYLE